MSAPAPDAGLRAQDAAARRLACVEFRRPVVLEAGAGTGKTAALVARMLAWSLGEGWRGAEASIGDGEAPEVDRVAAEVLGGMVAITFTEAAAAEMAARVDAALERVERGALPPGLDASGLPSDLARRPRARALRDALDHLSVSTIHAWCRRLLSSYPLEAGLHPRLEVDAEGRVRAAVVREVLEARLSREPERGGLLELAAAGAGPHELEQELLALLEAGMTAADLANDPLDAPRVSAFLERLAQAFERLLAATREGASSLRVSSVGAELVALLGATLPRLLGEQLSTPALALLVESLREEWEGSCARRLGDWGKARFTKEEQRAFGGREQEIARAARALAERLAHLASLDLETLVRARPLLAELLEEVEASLHAHGVTTFAGLLRGAHALLEGSPVVAGRVRRRIDQLLVDEFQDTDNLQCRILEILALEGPESERPGLFLVGDPKQSIYGWRNADLAAYERFVTRAIEAGGERCALCVNYRSVPAILAEVDRAIGPVMVAEPGVQPAFQRLVAASDSGHAIPWDDGRSSVEYWISVARDPESGDARTSAATAAALEARALASDLRSLHDEQDVAWRDVGVLFRSRGDWEVYLGALREAGIPFAVEGDRSYYRRREVIEAAAALRCVLDPRDEVALLALLRSPGVGVPDAALLPLWQRGLPERLAALEAPQPEPLTELRALLDEVARALPQGVPGLERVRGWERAAMAAFESVALLRSAFERDPADRFLERLRAALLLETTEAARYLGPWRLANLERFFRGLAEELAGGADVQSLLRQLRKSVSEEEPGEEAQPRELADDAVSLLTLHGAKGLGFQHVYLMQLHKGAGRTPSARVEPGRLDGEWEYRLLGAPTLGWDEVARARERVARAERVRTLYVAMTRAKRRLVLAGTWPAFSRRGRAESQVELLGRRRDGVPDLEAAFAELASRRESRLDALDARWVFPALWPASESGGSPVAPPRLGLPDAETASAAARALRGARSAAAARMARPLGGPASAEAHRDAHELRAARHRGEDPTAPASSGLGAALGTAIHRALETFDLDADPPVELERQRRELAPALLEQVPPEALPAALREAEGLLERVALGPLIARLRERRHDIVARELPVLLVPEPDQEPLAFVAGAVDLVLRDPDSGRLVVVDYKTDRLDDPEALAERTRRYALQGRVYQRALREALSLDYTPRFELWYLAHDRVVAA